MRELLLTIVISFIGFNAFSQQAEIVSTIPTNGDYGTKYDSFTIVFNQEVMIDEENPDYNFLSIIPEESAEITGVTISEDNKTVVFDLILEENTDYTAIIEDVYTPNWTYLDIFEFINFSTASTIGEYTITGKITTENESQLRGALESANGVVILSDSPLYLDDDDDDDMTIVVGSKIDPDSFEFVLEYVREGVYYPVAFLPDYENEIEQPFIFVNDSDNDEVDGVSSPIHVNQNTTTNGVFSDLILAELIFEKVTSHEAWQSHEIPGSVPENAYLVAILTEFYDVNMEEAVVWGDPEKIAKFKPFKKLKDTGIDPILEGKSLVWSFIYYDDIEDLLYFVVASPVDSGIQQVISAQELELPISFNTVKAITDDVLSSDEIANIIMDLDGGNIISEMFETENMVINISMELSHKYWELEENATEDAPIFWEVIYNFREIDDEYENELEYKFIIDAISGELMFTNFPVSNEVIDDLPNQFYLGQNYPNPFNPSTNIPFELSKSSNIELSIHNILGQKIATLAQGKYNAGTHLISWDATSHSSGIYFYKLNSDGLTQTRKLMLIK